MQITYQGTEVEAVRGDLVEGYRKYTITEDTQAPCWFQAGETVYILEEE